MKDCRKILFEKEAYSDFIEWAVLDKKLFKKIAKLIEECRRTPFEGTGKPEPLKHQSGHFWSRRINQEHRLIYSVNEDAIQVVACKTHYAKW